MSEKPHWERAIALSVFDNLAGLLKPVCERIELAGSLRRNRALVGDVEILYIPNMEQRAKDFFTTEPVNLVDEKLNWMFTNGIIEKRLSSIGVTTWGPLNKLGAFCENGMPVDFFCEPNPLDWWRSLVIRTGPKESNIHLITTAAKRGVSVHAYGVGLTDGEGQRIPCESEQHFFEICGVKYQEPEQRR